MGVPMVPDFSMLVSAVLTASSTFFCCACVPDRGGSVMIAVVL